MNTLLGVIVEIGDIKVFKSGFKMRSVVVDIGTSSNPNPIKIDCKDYAIEVLNDCSINDMVEVLYDIKGRKYEGKFYVSIISESLRSLSESEKPKEEVFDDDRMIPGNSLEEQDEWDSKIKDVPF